MGNLCCSYTVINQSTVGVFESFGKFSGLAEPGFHCLGMGKSVRGIMSLRVEQLKVRCETKTKVRKSYGMEEFNDSPVNFREPFREHLNCPVPSISWCDIALQTIFYIVSRFPE